MYMLYTAFLKSVFSTHDNICIYLLILDNFYFLTLIRSITQLSHTYAFTASIGSVSSTYSDICIRL